MHSAANCSKGIAGGGERAAPAHDTDARRRRTSKMKLKPLADRVIVLRIEEEQKTPGGIIVPDTAKEKPQQGKVIAVGPGRIDENGRRLSMEVKKNDKVLFGKYAGTEIKIDGVEHLIMKEDDILGIVQ
jgi:chaperonin GroES